ncbi:MAG: molybdopterin molybdotransferase MoeA [Planctomycetota bacterium]|jgi:molybdenum cofactor synthesis domain-containing protein
MVERDFGPMRPFGALTPVDEALRRLLDAVAPLTEAEGVPVIEALGRVAAETMRASGPVPMFARAMMDGFAVRHADVAAASEETPVTLRLLGAIHAGGAPEPIAAGECRQIATGGMIPEGADTVVQVELTHKLNEGEVQFLAPREAGANISGPGADFAAGDAAVHAGTIYTPAHCGAVASLGLARTWVLRKPRVAIWGTGDEVQPAGTRLTTGQIHDSNGPTLGALTLQHGGAPTLHGAMPDDLEEISAALDDPDAEIIVVTGGTSVGERDLVARAIHDKCDVLFHGLQVKPGKPTLAATRNGTLVVGVPGNPTSGLMMSYIFFVPALRKMAGLPPWEPERVDAILTGDVRSPAGKRQYYSVRLERDAGGDDGDGGGAARAVPNFKGSGVISSMSEADGWIVIDPEHDHLAAGTPVTVYLFG